MSYFSFSISILLLDVQIIIFIVKNPFLMTLSSFCPDPFTVVFYYLLSLLERLFSRYSVFRIYKYNWSIIQEYLEYLWWCITGCVWLLWGYCKNFVFNLVEFIVPIVISKIIFSHFLDLCVRHSFLIYWALF